LSGSTGISVAAGILLATMLALWIVGGQPEPTTARYAGPKANALAGRPFTSRAPPAAARDRSAEDIHPHPVSALLYNARTTELERTEAILRSRAAKGLDQLPDCYYGPIQVSHEHVTSILTEHPGLSGEAYWRLLNAEPEGDGSFEETVIVRSGTKPNCEAGDIDARLRETRDRLIQRASSLAIDEAEANASDAPSTAPELDRIEWTIRQRLVTRQDERPNCFFGPLYRHIPPALLQKIKDEFGETDEAWRAALAIRPEPGAPSVKIVVRAPGGDTCHDDPDDALYRRREMLLAELRASR
jgi:hypothetical protein